jgi:hypothetical protein
VKRRVAPEPPPSDERPDAEAAALERAASRPGWRMDGPEFAGAQRAVEQNLAARWWGRPEAERQAIEAVLVALGELPGAQDEQAQTGGE